MDHLDIMGEKLELGGAVSLGSDEDEHNLKPFSTTPAAKPLAASAKSSSPLNPSASMDLHEVCKEAATKLSTVRAKIIKSC